MALSERLYGTDLIDCAKANGEKGIEIAAQRCGYDQDLATFEHELKKAADHIGVEIQNFNDLVTDRADEPKAGIEVAPDSLIQL